MNNYKIWSAIDIILRWIVALIFIYAGLGKIMNPVEFAEDIDNYRLLPYLFVTLMAVILPWFEVCCGVLLLPSKFRAASALSLLILTFIFLIAIGSAIIRGLDISCGCFVTPGDWNKVGFARLFEDIALSVILSFIYLNAVTSTNHKA